MTYFTVITSSVALFDFFHLLNISVRKTKQNLHTLGAKCGRTIDL